MHWLEEYRDNFSKAPNVTKNKDTLEFLVLMRMDLQYDDSPIEDCNLVAKQMRTPFDNRYGDTADKVPACYVWTRDYIYASAQYDGAVMIYAIPRNPEVARRLDELGYLR